MPEFQGWSTTDIAKTQKILAGAEQVKSPFIKTLDSLIYWVALLIAITGNFILSVVLVPFMLILSGYMLYLTIFVVGISFGSLFTIIFGYLRKLETTHHIIAGIFIPAIAMINIYIITNLSNKLIEILELNTIKHDPLSISFTYIISFVAPYLYIRYRELEKKAKMEENQRII